MNDHKYRKPNKFLLIFYNHLLLNSLKKQIMKKLTFLFAMVFAASMAMAQTNVSDVDQTGVDQTATVDQQGSLNNSYILQEDKDNVATVSQINSTDGKTVNSDIKQTGKDNEASVKQHHNGNQAGGLDAWIIQSGDHNKAIQQQGPHGQMGDTYAKIDQSGDHNLAEQYQVKYGNDALIEQTGSWNTARQAQDRSLPADAEGSMNDASIFQSGWFNMAEQEQNGWSNDVKAEQTGNGNKSSQVQNAWVSTASVLQTGSLNMAAQDQTGSLNFAKIEQGNSLNKAEQTQVSNARRTGANYAALNEAEIFQNGGFLSGANVAIQDQTTPGGDIDKNYAGIWQTGSFNFASQTQSGGFNVSTVNQTGVGHSATVTQSQSIVQ